MKYHRKFLLISTPFFIQNNFPKECARPQSVNFLKATKKDMPGTSKLAKTHKYHTTSMSNKTSLRNSKSKNSKKNRVMKNLVCQNT